MTKTQSSQKMIDGQGIGPKNNLPSVCPPGNHRAPSVCPSMKVKVKVKVNIYRTLPNNQPSPSSTPKPRLTPRIDLKNFGKPTQNAQKLTQKNQQEKSLNESQKQLILKFSLTQPKPTQNPKKATTQSTLLRLKLG